MVRLCSPTVKADFLLLSQAAYPGWQVKPRILSTPAPGRPTLPLSRGCLLSSSLTQQLLIPQTSPVLGPGLERSFSGSVPPRQGSAKVSVEGWTVNAFSFVGQGSVQHKGNDRNQRGTRVGWPQCCWSTSAANCLSHHFHVVKYHCF